MPLLQEKMTLESIPVLWNIANSMALPIYFLGSLDNLLQ